MDSRAMSFGGDFGRVFNIASHIDTYRELVDCSEVVAKCSAVRSFERVICLELMSHMWLEKKI